MHIVFIDGDHQEREIVGRCLEITFQGAKVTIFRGVGWFLEEYERLQKPFVLVLEVIQPLFAVENGDDELIQRVERLKVRFPWLGDDWEGLRGGEVLIRGIRSIQSDLPIIVYTDVDYGQVSEDIKEMSMLKICEKGDDGNFLSLARKIHSFET